MSEAVLYTRKRETSPQQDRSDEDLLTSYTDDIKKYPVSAVKKKVISHVFSSMLNHPMQRITFNGYEDSNYGFSKVRKAFKLFRKAMLRSIEYALTSTSLYISVFILAAMITP